MTAMIKHQSQAEMDYGRIATAIRYLDRRHQSQPSLADVAGHVHLSPFHFERLFLRWAGVSPKKYLQYLTKEHARTLLKDSRSVLDATYESGLSSPGRLHDLLVTWEGVTPGEMKRRGQGLKIKCGVHDTPFGPCLIGVTPKGICALQFIESGRAGNCEELIQTDWPCAEVRRDDAKTSSVAETIFVRNPGPPAPGLRLFLRGTKFQLLVWQALLRIPPGAVATYQAIAETVGNARACRAVGGAVGSNPIAWLIPCHRVLRESGRLGGYRWGLERKRAMLFREFARTTSK
jgi:AraC family transcriptional regulator of adaptative response/methylated-DNA-[protein]-cysteine methyltransferase